MEIACSIYSGAGNSFVMIDGRNGTYPTDTSVIAGLCSRYGTDGLMVLGASESRDFSMLFFNPDGSSGMMCGNGGRCIAAFAADLGLVPSSEDGVFIFEGPDSIHSAHILDDDGKVKTVRLGMKDVSGISAVREGYFVDTGARHFVVFTDDIENVDIAREGTRMRHFEEFAPEGANVDFVRTVSDGCLEIRTFEKGVEAETLACGTGIVAAAVVAFHCGAGARDRGGRVHYRVKARRNTLEVDFTVPGKGSLSGMERAMATEVYLTGPAEKIG